MIAAKPQMIAGEPQMIPSWYELDTCRKEKVIGGGICSNRWHKMPVFQVVTLLTIAGLHGALAKSVTVTSTSHVPPQGHPNLLAA